MIRDLMARASSAYWAFLDLLLLEGSDSVA
jgi:hypothetical protein